MNDQELREKAEKLFPGDHKKQDKGMRSLRYLRQDSKVGYAMDTPVQGKAHGDRYRPVLHGYQAPEVADPAPSNIRVGPWPKAR